MAQTPAPERQPYTGTKVLIAVRVERSLIDKMDAARSLRGWTRTTFVLRALGAAIERDLGDGDGPFSR